MKFEEEQRFPARAQSIERITHRGNAPPIGEADTSHSHTLVLRPRTSPDRFGYQMALREQFDMHGRTDLTTQRPARLPLLKIIGNLCTAGGKLVHFSVPAPNYRMSKGRS